MGLRGNWWAFFLMEEEAVSRVGAPNLQDLMPDDLRWSWCNNNRNIVRNKCNAFEPSWNHPSPLESVEKLSSAKLVPTLEGRLELLWLSCKSIFKSNSNQQEQNPSNNLPLSPFTQKSVGSITIWNVKAFIWQGTQRKKGIWQLFFFFGGGVACSFSLRKGASIKIWPLALFWDPAVPSECAVCALIKVSYWLLVWIPGQAPDVTQPTAWTVTLNYNLKLPWLEVMFPSQLNKLIHTEESISALILFAFIYQKMALHDSTWYFLRVTLKNSG